MNDIPSDRNIRIGTSGYSYEDWVGPVYPKNIRKSEMLGYYANELKLDSVELSDTYHAMPTVRGVEEMIKETPENFMFAVKAHSSITHRIRDKDGSYIRDEGAVGAFLSGLEPMVQSNRLICVLAQFPIKFSHCREAEEHLKWLAGTMVPIRLTVELRNRSWVRHSVFDLLKSVGAAYCVVDGPDLPRLAPFTAVATSSPAYFRFHGRNMEWFNVSASQRYNYLYSDMELRRMIGPVNKVISASEETVIFFNNHPRGSAVKNATRMKQLLGIG